MTSKINDVVLEKFRGTDGSQDGLGTAFGSVVGLHRGPFVSSSQAVSQ